MMKKFEVVLSLEIKADTPERAAVIARDMMLNADETLLMDVYPFEYIKEAEEWHPTHKWGWQARFERRGSVRPSGMIEWYRVDCGDAL